MGGASAQVSESTENILLEGAYFSPGTVRRSANEHKLHTEASHRFERGTDSKQYERCLLRCLQLIKQHQPQAKILTPKTVRKKSKKQEKITYRAADFEKLIGYNPGKNTIRDNFKRLGLQIEKTDSSWQVTPPSWRTDLERKEDLTEEIVRLHGYEQIPVSYPKLNIQRTAIPRKSSYEKISQFMAARGFCENITFSFVSENQQDFYGDVQPYQLSNPLSKRQAVMRQSLLDGLLSSYEHNCRAGEKDIRIFELGRIYPGDGSDEPRCLGLICSGKLYGENWDDKNRDFDFYDLKGLVVNLLRRLGYSNITFRTGEAPGFSNECCARIYIDEQEVGTAGEIDSALPEDFVEQALLACQINIDRLPETGDTDYTPYSNQPTVLRDLDLVVDIDQAVGPLRETIREAARWLENITIFDIYQGKPLPEDKKSVSFNLVFRHPRRTLSDREVGETQEKIINALRKQHNARLREA
jgi:phenylalanyl-tRNA synthetase beta chain